LKGEEGKGKTWETVGKQEGSTLEREKKMAGVITTFRTRGAKSFRDEEGLLIGRKGMDVRTYLFA